MKTAAILIICFASGFANAADSVRFEEHILPLFYQRCFSCHSEKKEEPKGGLKLDSVKAIRESGVIVPRKPDESELLIRISLPHEDDSFMPPLEGGAQPFDEDELAMMKAWIRNGATFGNWVRFEHRQAPLEVAGESLSMDDVPRLTAKLDELVEQSGGKRNPPVSDETFLRRIYLDAIGRIPTLAESRAFLANSDPDKRANLIQHLLASEGFVSHMFNWKANQLRLDPHGIPGQPGWTYDEWVKEAIRSGRNYDTFVRELITAEGHLWTNAATGFYLRDQGMPLDHLSNLMRLFLGTRIECAQCHDHPFEPITQQDFYQLASFTYGVSVMFGGQSYDVKQVEHWPALKQRLQEENSDKEFSDTVSRTIAPLKRRTADTDGILTYGEEFIANPDFRGSEVAFRTLFGDEAVEIEGRREAFARWVTSPRNPRFARNIANRLWKRVFGVGLIEPVDSLSPVDRPEHPEILEFISEAMTQLGFDERAFLAMLFNSRLYQSEAVREESSVGDPMELGGPWLRRLTAEQLWDSTLTLLVPDLDERKSSRGDLSYLQNLAGMSADELWDLAGERLEIRRWHRDHQKQIFDAENAIRIAEAARDEAKVAQLKKHRDELRRKQYQRPYPDRLPPIKPKPDPRWNSLNPGFVRASELTAPSRLGHYLRFFGQSDRREIDANNEDPSISQSLALMNGELTQKVTHSKSLLRRTLAEIADVSPKITAIYQSILARQPTDDEMETCQALFETSPTPNEDLIWALLTSPEFLFQQ